MFSLRRVSKFSICVVFFIAMVAVRNVRTANAQDDTPRFKDSQLEFFEAQVRPLLVAKCYDCHGPEAAPVEGGLSLESRKSILAGGDTGAAIEPGQPDESLLIDAINYGDVYEMPPDTKLPQDEIDILTKWVKMGAPWPADSDVAVETEKVFDLQSRKSSHWCWQPAKLSKTPDVSDKNWPLNLIDNFILAKLEQAQLQPSIPATKRALIRRLYFDLIGLPPTPEQVRAFLEDNSKDAYSKVVDDLLASERFGERWARHWMDLARYAETCGHEFDYPIPHAYQYRDYLIRAFNNDVPYDQFIREHIAGDLIANPRRHITEDYDESILGTGFWFLHEGHHGPVDVKADEAKRIDNQIDVMTKTFLGLTVSCARCHDHKFDAISTKDYYSLYGFLKSSHRQVAMLDPGREIEKSFAASTELAKQSTKIIRQISDEMSRTDKAKLTAHLNAAIIQLRNDPDWSRPNGLVIQGETFRVIHNDSGTVQPQQLPPNKNFAWQGDEQIWWVDGQIGDTTTLEFDLDSVAGKRKYEVFLCLTKAADYGRAKITLNDTVLHEDFDCFNKGLTTTGAMSFGKVELSPGKQTIVLEITGHNENAIQRHMLGIDYIELVPDSETADQPTGSPADLDRSRLNDVFVDRLAAGIKSARLHQPYHPLHVLQNAAKGNTKLDGSFVKTQRAYVDRQRDKQAKLNDQTVLFADFNDGLPAGWNKTGFAFADHDRERISIENEFLAEPTAVHSGSNGRKYKGVIRSPSFVIEHDKIFYRVKGNRAQIRLIIEGYQLDVYNELLFKGMRIDLPSSVDYRWIEQARDLKNHKGRRAHIEIIDQSDGFVSVDEIRFSNGPAPDDGPATTTLYFVKHFNDDSEFSTETIAEFFADQIVELARSSGTESVALMSWILDNKLAELFSADNNSDVSFGNKDFDYEQAKSSPKSMRSLENDLRQVRVLALDVANNVPDPLMAVGIVDGTPTDESIFIRGNHKTLGEPAKRNFLTALTPVPMKIESGSGRLLLANRIADSKNPLTARVAVNRVWHHLMGRGIVRSVDNFGVLGQKPTHPELLDYLAIKFSENDWSIKQLIRNVVHSRTYQMSSVVRSANKTADPNNNLFHAANIHRLEGEAIRDSILTVSGQLDQTMYGKPEKIHLTPFMGGRGRPGKSGPLDGNGRRSIYIEVRRNFLSPMMLAFDTPIPFNAIGRRNRSNVPAQALILMNDPFVFEQAGKWAEKLIEEGDSNLDRVTKVYWQALGRPPTSDELKESLTFLNSAAESEGQTDETNSNFEIWRDFCHVIFNIKQFIYIE